MQLALDIMALASPAAVPASLAARPGRRALGKYAAIAALTVGLASTAFAVDSWVTWVGYWFIASLIHLGLLASGHELVHHHLFANRRTNNAVSYVIGFLTFVPAASYRFYHLQHHAKLGTEDDPEGILGLELNRLQLFGALFVSGFMVLGDLLYEVLLAVSRRPLRWGKGDRARTALAIDFAVLIASVSVVVVVGLSAGFRGIAFAWLIPFVVSMSFWSAFIALPEHYGLTPGDGPADLSRNIVSNRVFSWLYWDTNFHATHHWAPQVPYNQLRTATELRDWPHQESSYLALWRKFVASTSDNSVIDLRDSAKTPETIDLRQQDSEAPSEVSRSDR